MKTIFLDLDGTLIDSSARHILLLKDILLHEGLKAICVDDYLECKRNGQSTKAYLVSQQGFSEERASYIAEKWVNHIEDSDYLKYDRLYEDVFPFLNRIKGNTIIYLSARKNRAYLDKYLIDNLLDTYCLKTIVVSPANSKIEKKRQIELINKDDVIVVGDTEADYFDDIKCFMLNRGFRSKHFWDKKGVHSYSSLMEIVNYIIEK